MSESTMTVKGQTTVPQPIREALQVRPGSRLTWNLMPDGTAMPELEWVLRSNFGFDKGQIIQTLSSLLATSELSFESESSVEVSLELFRQNKAAFSDCIHIALSHAAGMTPMWTFDRMASKVDGAKLLSDETERV